MLLFRTFEVAIGSAGFNIQAPNCLRSKFPWKLPYSWCLILSGISWLHIRKTTFEGNLGCRMRRFIFLSFLSNFGPLGDKSGACNTNYFNFIEGRPKYKMPSKISGPDLGWPLRGGLLHPARPEVLLPLRTFPVKCCTWHVLIDTDGVLFFDASKKLKAR